MKKLIFALLILSLATPCYAKLVVVDQYDKVIAKIDEVKNKTGLERRKEKTYNLPAELEEVDVADLRVQGNKIVKRKLSSQEEQEIERKKIWDEEEYEILKYYKNKAIDEMIAAGVHFKYDHKLP